MLSCGRQSGRSDRQARLLQRQVMRGVDNMSKVTYVSIVSPAHKPLVWLRGEVKTPPFSSEARIQAGYLLRMLRSGQSPTLPHSRPMPVIGARCHELRIQDENRTWRVMYRVDADAVVIADVFAKTSQTTPTTAIKNSQRRLRAPARSLEGIASDGTREAKTLGESWVASWKHCGVSRPVGC